MINYRKIILSMLLISVFLMGISIVSAADDTVLDDFASSDVVTSENGAPEIDSLYEAANSDITAASDEAILASDEDEVQEDYREETYFDGKNIKTYTAKSTTKNIKTVKVTLKSSYYAENIANKKITYTFKGKTKSAKTDNNGVVKIKINVPKTGTYKVKFKFEGDSGYYATSKTITVTVKNRYKIYASNSKYAYKKNKYYKIKVKDIVSKKPVKYLKVKVKIGSKTYKLKTNKRGIVKISTKKLKKGKHKVTVTSLNKKVKVSAKANLTIYDPTIHTKSYTIKYNSEYDDYDGMVSVGKGEVIGSYWIPGYDPQSESFRVMHIHCYGDSIEPEYHKIIKAKVFYKEDSTDAKKVVTYKPEKNYEYLISFSTPYGYTPYKVTVTYKTYSKKLRWD